MILANSVTTLLFLLVGFNWTSFAEEFVSQEKKNARVPRLVIGGTPANEKQFPYAVSLQRRIGHYLNYQHRCTFSLITTQSIIGAAHCVLTKNGAGKIDAVGDYIGVLGSTDFTNRNHTVIFSKFRVHRCFNHLEIHNDIAILIIASPVQTSEFVKTIPLIGRNVNFVGKSGTIIGWGITEPYAIRPSRTLNYAHIDIPNIEVCQNYYWKLDLDQRQVCYGTKGKTGCKWDSGGPVKISIGNVNDVLAGVNSYGSHPCAVYPNVALNISAYTTWIMRRVVGTPVFIN